MSTSVPPLDRRRSVQRKDGSLFGPAGSARRSERRVAAAAIQVTALQLGVRRARLTARL